MARSAKFYLFIAALIIAIGVAGYFLWPKFVHKKPPRQQPPPNSAPKIENKGLVGS